jgi:hypothetical protein
MDSGEGKTHGRKRYDLCGKREKDYIYLLGGKKEQFWTWMSEKNITTALT